MENWRETLRHEFEAREGSFLLKLRCNPEWDRSAFSRLVAAMEACAAASEDEEICERWIAFGFWYLQLMTKAMSSPPEHNRRFEDRYYERAYRQLDDLAYWYFTGHSP